MQASELQHTRTGAGAPHVLVVDDDAEIGLLLSRYLGGQGLRVSVAGSGAQMRDAIVEHAIDAVLLDLGLPDEDGLVLIRELRSRWHGPVIIISGRGESVERVVGLELGADDYVTKPFDLRELLARIRSVLRRSQAPAAADPSTARGYAFAGFRLDVPSRALMDPDGRDIALTSGEFDLLLVLVQRAHRVLTRDQLMNACTGATPGPTTAPSTSRSAASGASWRPTPHVPN
jgi:DNA-binding response OmpR family regulator